MLRAEKGPLGLAMMNIHYEKPVDYRCCGSAFRGKIPPKNASCWSRLWRNIKLKKYKINAVYFYHSFIDANLHHCFAALIIFWCQKNVIFTLKIRKQKQKHADLIFFRMGSWNGQIAFPRTWKGSRGPLSSNPLGASEKWIQISSTGKFHFLQL